MKTTIIFLSVLSQFIYLINVKAQTNSEILTNESIVQLFDIGLDTSVIVSKIKTTKSSFDVSTDALIKLKNQKIPKEIIVAMVNAASGTNNFVVTDFNDPLSPHKSGIYYYRTKNDSFKIFPLDATIYSQAKSTGYITNQLTYGLSGIKYKATIDGQYSRFQTSNPRPIFYFYFDKDNNNLNQTNSGWFSSANTPNEFLAIELAMRPKVREITVGSCNIGGGVTGVDNNNKIPLKYEKVADGIYKVFFTEDLPVGEYCFMYAGGSVVNGSTPSQKVYDFGVTSPKSKVQETH